MTTTNDSTPANICQRVLATTTLTKYPLLREAIQKWLAERADIWWEFVQTCYRIAGGNQDIRLLNLMSGWLLLFAVSSPLDDYVDGDRAAGAWGELPPQVGHSIGLALIAEGLSLVTGGHTSNDLVLHQASAAMTERLRDAALGQAWDNAGVQSLAEYEQMLELKAATLLSALTEGIAIVAEAAPATGHALSDYGREIGLAIQIVNDYLGVWKPEVLGKQPGGDLRQHPLTYPLFYALNTPHSYRAELEGLLALPSGQRDTERILAILNNIGAPQFLRALIEQNRTRARRAIETLATTTDLMRLDRWFAQHMLGVTLG